MRARALASGLLFLLGISSLLSCAGSHGPVVPAAPSSEVLYVLDNGSVASYSIDPASLTATSAGQPITLVPPPASVMQFDPSPHDHFVYTVWADAQNLQHLSVFQTDSFGVPQLPAMQTLDADSLSQFNMHPSGRFAYMLQVRGSNNEYNGQYYAKIRLFNVESTGGKLKENVQFQGTYGPAPFWPAFLYGFSPDGSKLYVNSQGTTGSNVLQRPINKNNGTLGANSQLIGINNNLDVAIGALIAVQHQNATTPNQGYLDIFPNVPNPKRAIHCTMAMLGYCATASNIRLDPSSRYLFLSDPSTAMIHVATINTAQHRIVDTGNSMPMTAQTPGFAFNQSGNIVYAMQTDGSVHFFHFAANTGAPSEGGVPLPIANDGAICPAHRQ